MLDRLKTRRLLRLLEAGPANAKAHLGHNVELLVNILVIGAALAFMLFQGAGFAIRITQLFAIFAILAVSLNLVLGYTGLLSIAHVAFFRNRGLHRGRVDHQPRLRAGTRTYSPFRVDLFRGVAGGHGYSRSSGPVCGECIKPVSRRLVRSGLRGICGDRPPGVPLLAAGHQRRIWYPCNRQTLRRPAW